MDSSKMIDNPLSNLQNAGRLSSPFLQVDPSILQSKSSPSVLSNEFILLDGHKPSRGRFELAFVQIGSSVIIGGGIGGTMGFFRGINDIYHNMPNETIGLKRTQMLNHIVRNGANVANSFGTIALLYSAIGVGLSFIQDSNDEANTFIAATSTGAIYGAVSHVKAYNSLKGAALKQLRLKRIGFGLTGGLIAAGSLITVMSYNVNDKFESVRRSLASFF